MLLDPPLAPALFLSTWRDFLKRRDQIAGEKAVAETFAQHPFGDLAGDGGASTTAVFSGASGDERSQSSLHVNVPFELERPVRVLDRVRVHLQVGRKRPDRW